VSVYPALVPQLQLWHLYWLRSIHSVSDLHAYLPRCYTSCLKETLLLLSKHVRSFMSWDRMCWQFPPIRTSSTIVATGGSENVMCLCLFHDHATTHRHCCVLCAFSTNTTLSVIVTNNNAENCVRMTVTSIS